MSIDLLQKRVKVIAWYPGCRFDVGTVLYLHDNVPHYGFGVYTMGETSKVFTWDCIGRDDVEKATANFKPLKWWQYRDSKDLPEYMKYVGCEAIVTKCSLHQVLGVGFNNEHGVWIEYDHVLPATREEYEAYLKTK